MGAGLKVKNLRSLEYFYAQEKRPPGVNVALRALFLVIKCF